jgi:4'-phosphopantetheinyl transferase
LSPSIELRPDVVDVWTAPLNVDEHRMEDLLHRLSTYEQKRVGALLEEKAVRQYVVSRAMQRQLLASYVGGSPSDIQFGIVAMGKPTLSRPNDIGLQFNTTHSGSLVVIAVTKDRDVGVDVEQIRPVPRALKVARRCYSKDEYEALVALEGEELERAFLATWVSREGTAKARGDSVWRGLASWRNGEMEYLRDQFRVEFLELGPGFVGVVVARGDDWKVRYRGRPPGF